MPTYSYLPLRQDDAIRLLELSPGTRDDIQVHCNVTRRRLSDKVLNYEAISYTWGHLQDRETLFCGGNHAALSITRNCYNALRSLRHATQPRSLWIDAVSINQEDTLERNAQVRIMDRIYANASRVVVYLGEESHGSRLLFEELASADQFCQSKGSYNGRLVPSAEIIKELNLLLQRPCFSRVWILQEVRNARQLTVMCGNSQASMKALQQCIFGYRDDRVTESYAPPLFDLTRGYHLDHTVFSLWKVLGDTRSCKATDPRDRIFAVIPLLAEPRDELAHFVDYSRSFERTYADITMFILQSLELRILLAVQHPHTLSLPSWMPDWSGNSAPHRWGFDTVYPDTRWEDFTVCQLGCSHEACGGQHPVLRVTGVRNSRIGHLGAPFDFGDAQELCLETIRLVLDLQDIEQVCEPEATDQDGSNSSSGILTPTISESKYSVDLTLAIRT